VSDEDKKQKLADIPPLAAICVVATAITLVVALMANASIEVRASLAALLAALALYIRRTLG
jgi:hypothetical protein